MTTASTAATSPTLSQKRRRFRAAGVSAGGSLKAAISGSPRRQGGGGPGEFGVLPALAVAVEVGRNHRFQRRGGDSQVGQPLGTRPNDVVGAQHFHLVVGDRRGDHAGGGGEVPDEADQAGDPEGNRDQQSPALDHRQHPLHQLLEAIGRRTAHFEGPPPRFGAGAAAHAVADTETAGRTFELGGPTTYSFKELMERMLAVIERRRLLVAVPFGVASLIGLIGDLAAATGMVAPPITHDQVEMLRADNVVGAGSQGLADLGVAATALEPVIPTYLYRYRKGGQYAELT